ncbi:MAG: cytochrome c3 family protein [Myxococcales bacterium]|nr:cytochrome c3 family protein [Myxococcales bacterium]
MKRALAGIIAVAFVMAIAGAALAVTDVIEMSKGGAAKVVKFTHKAHAGYAANDCKKCHHTGQNTNCKGCHDATGSKANGLKGKDAFHKQCKACHTAAGKGPTSCAGCHAG